MKTAEQILVDVRRLPSRERAAAIMHSVYMMTADRIGWEKRVETEWNQLSSEAQSFNLASVDTWLRETKLYDAWCDAIEEIRKGQ